MENETIIDLSEQISDWLGIYGSCKSNGDTGCEFDENKPFCCRQGFVSTLAERISKAKDVEKLTEFKFTLYTSPQEFYKCLDEGIKK